MSGPMAGATTDAGRGIVSEPATESDVVVQNFCPGAMVRLGIDYESMMDKTMLDEEIIS